MKQRGKDHNWLTGWKKMGLPLAAALYMSLAAVNPVWAVQERPCLSCHQNGARVILGSLGWQGPWVVASQSPCPAVRLASKELMLTASRLERLAMLLAVRRGEPGMEEPARALEDLRLRYEDALARPLHFVSDIEMLLAPIRLELDKRVYRPLLAKELRHRQLSFWLWVLAMVLALALGAFWGMRRLGQRGAGPLSRVERGSLEPDEEGGPHA